MTKQDFINYLTEAVNGMDERNLDALFPNNEQPDLYTLLEAMTGLRGEVKKVAQASLRLQNEVQHLVGKQQEILDKTADLQLTSGPAAAQNAVETVDPEDKKNAQDLRYILRELIKLEAVIGKTSDGLDNLPEATIFGLNDFKNKFSAWEQGFSIFEKQWKALLKSTGMYQTGKVGTQFDPELHEAVATGKDPNFTDNTILETEQIGYLYKNKIIQQAKVVVNRLG